jgi:hypothetical protein
VSSRPLMQHKIGQLEELFSNSGTDVQSLKELEEELQSRHVPRAVKLLAKVQAVLKRETTDYAISGPARPVQADHSSRQAELWEGKASSRPPVPLVQVETRSATAKPPVPLVQVETRPATAKPPVPLVPVETRPARSRQPAPLVQMETRPATARQVLAVVKQPVQEAGTVKSREMPDMSSSMSEGDAYKVLKASPTSTWESIEQTRRHLVQQAHPEHMAMLSPERRTQVQQEARRANEAYAVLLKRQ